MKKVLLAFLGSFATMFILGGLWNGLILSDFYIQHSPIILRPEAEFNLPIIAVGYLVLTSIMTLIAGQNFKSPPKVLDQFMFGATFGLAATLPLYLVLWGRWDYELSYGIVDSMWHVFEQGLGALVLIKILTHKTKKNETI